MLNILRLVKKNILRSKQAAIIKRYPRVKITLHQDMPSPSMNKMVEVSRIVDQVNALETRIASLSDLELKEKKNEFKKHIAEKAALFAGEFRTLQEEMSLVAMPEEKEKLKDKLKASRNQVFAQILPEAFAVVREASRRTIGLRHFDVQIAGGVILHEGRIAEMSTGEGKTLVATLPAYLNALLGKGVHVITVNDYLARRDSNWMGPVYEFLGLSVGVIQHDMSDEDRRRAYASDITYGTNNEFGFDYLRDNMKYSREELVQRGFYFAIVDEVDSILIDEARTPLIISGPAEESTDKYYTAKKIVEQLKGRRVTENDEINAKYKGVDLAVGFDYKADEKAQTVALTEEGEAKAARAWGVDSLHTLEAIEFRHHTIQALRAKEFFERDVDYVVKDGQVIIVDEFTGRLMPGRRWSDGLHQAVESKEGLKIERENQTLATITFQNYFRMYEKLSGMTGTAFTESNEFKSIYQLDVVVLPTNQALIRKNYSDRIFKTEKEKFEAVVEEIVVLHNQGTPVLVGTITIDKSELLSEMLKRRGVTHQVLNAKYHEMEAQIIAQAGRFKAVTIATNMAGRGTDILLGGNPEFMAKNLVQQKLKPDDPIYAQEYQKILARYKSETSAEHAKVVQAGGLHVLGTERHEARRIDNQLRGRSGRQGDPGSSRFYVSLSDDLMRLFGSEKIIGIMEKLGLEEGQVIEHPWVTGSIEVAQRRVEQHNFEIRKQLLEYDNVMNKQREIIYGQRRQILDGFSLKENIQQIISGIIERSLQSITPVVPAESNSEETNLIEVLNLRFGLQLNNAEFSALPLAEAKERMEGIFLAAYAEKEKAFGEDTLRQLERIVFLQIIDAKWKDHLYAMDSLREGIGLRAYGQRDPLLEYKREAFGMFSEMISLIEEEAVETIFKLKQAKQEKLHGVFSSLPTQMLHPETEQFNQAQGPLAAPVSQEGVSSQSAGPVTAKSGHKVGRNDLCPCGSGKKYKKCCGS